MKEPEKLTIIYPYYENPTMLGLHLTEWSQRYSAKVKSHSEVIIVDDCSARHPALPIINGMKGKLGFPIRLFKINEKVMWNWIGARNIGAHVADDSWLFMSDMDLMLRAEDVEQVVDLILTKQLKEDAFYLFDRIVAPDNRPYKAHPNTYLHARSLYWEIGGYDETFSGLYGCDGMYRRMMLRQAMGGHKHLHGINVTYYPRSFVTDSGVQDDGRKETRDNLKNKQFVKATAKKLANGEKPKALTFAYTRLV